MGITKSPGYQFHKEIDQPENEKALGPISKPLATVVGFRLLLIWAFWSISTGWIGHKWPENIGRHGSKFVCMWSSSSAISRRPHHPQINNAKDNASYVVGISWVIQARTGCHRWTSTPLLNRFSHHVILASTIPDHLVEMHCSWIFCLFWCCLYIWWFHQRDVMKLVGEQFQPRVHQWPIITLCCLKKTCSKIDQYSRSNWGRTVTVHCSGWLMWSGAPHNTQNSLRVNHSP